MTVKAVTLAIFDLSAVFLICAQFWGVFGGVAGILKPVPRPAHFFEARGEKMFPEIVKRALFKPVADIGQLSAEELRTLNRYVKKGYLSKGKGGGFPAMKTIYARPGFDFAADREAQVAQLLRECEALGERVTLKFERGKAKRGA